MRIIAGSARGKRLTAPPGLHTRPTTDRVKESIFNIIQFDVPGARVLDLFSGSGQLGLECLSRGAAFCQFCDNDRGAIRAIRGNIAQCAAQEKSSLFCGDWKDLLAQSPANDYHIVLLDPPYGGKTINEALCAIYRFDILAARGIIVCESAREDGLAPPPAPYRLQKRYVYGATAVTTLTRDET